MYSVGTLLVYGRNGVCEVEAVGPLKGSGDGREYYTLRPLYGTETIYAPVDTKMTLRPVLTRDQAEELVHSIPDIPAEQVELTSLPALSRYYQAAGRTTDCRELVRFIKTLHAHRSPAAHSRGPAPGRMEDRYLHQAEEQLWGELGVALGIGRDAVPDYIETALHSGTAS